MKIVLAAIDNSAASKPVLDAAEACAELFGARVEAFHVASNGSLTAESVAAAAGVPLHTASGPVVQSIVAAARAPGVVGVVLGARSTPASPRPFGSTAAAVATTLEKPVVIVPPEAGPIRRFRRVLVPIEGREPRSPRSIIELAADATLDAIALHVYEADTIPSFTDRPQHEQPAWTAEFLQRYCPGLDSVRLETRVGRTADVVADVASECACDLVALGWSQELEAGRASVVRGTLERSRLPVLLVPVESAETRIENHALPGFAAETTA